GMIDNYWLPGATTFDIDGSVSFKPYSDADAEAGWWCKPSGPKATYSWSVQGDTLVLAPLGGEDRCRERGDVYTGTWTRVRRSRMAPLAPLRTTTAAGRGKAL